MNIKYRIFSTWY